MKARTIVISAALCACAAALPAPGAYAYSLAAAARRELYQQDHLGQGLANSHLSAAEKARFQAVQNNEGRAIYRQGHEAQAGGADPLSSSGMQKDAVHDLRHEQRVACMPSGEFTGRKAAQLTRGQARDDRALARTGGSLGGSVRPPSCGGRQSG